MIEKTQKKFIQVSMLSFSIVLLVVLVVINTVTIVENVSRLDSIASVLAENGGSFTNPANPSPPMHANMPMPDRETQMSTRYFTAIASLDNTVQTINTSHSLAVSTDQAANMVANDLASGKTRGWSGNFRYLVNVTSSQKTLIYVNAGREINMIRSTLITSAATFVACLFVVYLLLRFFSKRAIQPLIDNIQRQKEFISNASHEIKTPLAILSANNDVLEMSGNQGKWTDSNRRQIKRLNQLVEQMLLLSRFDEGRADLHPQEIELKDFLQKRLEEVSPLYQEAGMTIQMDDLQGHQVTADKASFKQLVTILLENAVKYSEQERLLEIKLTREKPLTISFINSCEPITQKEADQLFERFYRREESRTRQEGGNGMGLAIARSIAQTMDIELQAKVLAPERIAFELIFK